MVLGGKALTRKQQQQRKKDLYEYYKSTKESLMKKGLGKMEIYEHIAEVFGYAERNSVAGIIGRMKKAESNS